MGNIEYKCKQCRDTGWALTIVQGQEQYVMCYCHPLVKNGSCKALEGSYQLGKYIEAHKGKKRKHV